MTVERKKAAALQAAVGSPTAPACAGTVNFLPHTYYLF